MPVNHAAGKVLATFTSYNPDIELLERGLFSIKSQVDEIVIVDNGSSNVELVRELAARSGSQLIAFPENRGIAAAFNAAFLYAKDNSCLWVLTCDQDSVMVEGMITCFLNAVSSFEDSERLAIVCPNFYNRTTGCLEYEGEVPRLLDSCISSGSLTLVSAWEEVAGFDEAMFIDGVDFEFCDRLHDAGYEILLVPDVHMEHEIGSAILHGIPGRKFLVLNHSAFRKFYIAQNIVYRDAKRRGGRISPVAYLKVLKQMLMVVAYEEDKAEKLVRIQDGMRRGVELAKTIRRSNYVTADHSKESW